MKVKALEGGIPMSKASFSKENIFLLLLKLRTFIALFVILGFLP